MQTTNYKKVIIFCSLVVISLYSSNYYFVSNFSNLILIFTIIANFTILFNIFNFNNLRSNKYNFLIFSSIILFLGITFYFSTNTYYEIFRYIFLIVCLYTYVNISKENFDIYTDAIKLFFNIFFPILFVIFMFIYFRNLPRTSVYFQNIAYLSGFFLFSLSIFIIQKKKIMIILALIGLALTFTKSTILASLFLLINLFKNKYLKFLIIILFVFFLITFLSSELKYLPFFQSDLLEPYRLFTGFNRRDIYWLSAIERLSIEPQGMAGMLDIIRDEGLFNSSLHSVWFDNIVIYGYLNFSIYLFILIKFLKFNIGNLPYYILMSFITITPGGIGILPHLLVYFMLYNNRKLDNDTQSN